MQRSTVSQLPEDVRDALDRRLIDGNFTDYTGLAAWLQEQGFEISRAAVYRHGRTLEERLERIRVASEEAQAIGKVLEDDGAAIARSAILQTQVKMHELQNAVAEGDVKSAVALARGIAEVTRAGISLRIERQRAREQAATAADGVAKRRGLSSDVAAEIRAAIEGSGPAA